MMLFHRNYLMITSKFASMTCNSLPVLSTRGKINGVELALQTTNWEFIVNLALDRQYVICFKNILSNYLVFENWIAGSLF